MHYTISTEKPRLFQYSHKLKFNFCTCPKVGRIPGISHGFEFAEGVTKVLMLKRFVLSISIHHQQMCIDDYCSYQPGLGLFTCHFQYQPLSNSDSVDNSTFIMCETTSVPGPFRNILSL